MPMNKRHAQELIQGAWVLTRREGQTEWPRSIRIFQKKFYSWEDLGRTVGEQLESGHYEFKKNCTIVTHAAGKGPKGQERKTTYKVSFDDSGNLHIQRVEPTLGKHTVYKRLS